MSLAYPGEYKQWHDISNTIITLACKNEEELCILAEILEETGLQHIRFFEPDLADSLTAIGIVPSPLVKKYCSNLPLAGKLTQDEAKKKKWLMETKEIVFESVNETSKLLRERVTDLLNLIEHPEQPPKFSWRLPTWFFPYAASMHYSLFKRTQLVKAALLHTVSEEKLEFILGTKVDESGKLLLSLAQAHLSIKTPEFKPLMANLETDGWKICEALYGVNGSVK